MRPPYEASEREVADMGADTNRAHAVIVTSWWKPCFLVSECYSIKEEHEIWTNSRCENLGNETRYQLSRITKHILAIRQEIIQQAQDSLEEYYFVYKRKQQLDSREI